jgi:hypothetical protein
MSQIPDHLDAIYAMFDPTTWGRVSPGDPVWLDHYQHGAKPQANPKIAGPFVVINTRTRTLAAVTRSGQTRRVFSHLLDNLLVERSTHNPPEEE